MRTKRVSTNPNGALVVLYCAPGRQPVLHLNAELVNDAQAAELGRRLAADPDLRAKFGVVA